MTDTTITYRHLFTPEVEEYIGRAFAVREAGAAAIAAHDHAALDAIVSGLPDRPEISLLNLRAHGRALIERYVCILAIAADGLAELGQMEEIVNVQISVQNLAVQLANLDRVIRIVGGGESE
jgi:hypothetical protein